MITVVDRREVKGPLPPRILAQSWYRSLMRSVPLCVSGAQPIPIAIVYVDPPAMRTLNRDYRGIARVTDVLSYGYTDSEGKRTEGEIVICSAQALRQRHRFRTTVLQEFCRLFFHGLLHIYEYDHSRPAARRAMRKAERCLMKISKPYLT